MRYQEIASGLRIAVSCEEQELLDKKKEKAFSKKGLDERELELARLMVSKGILDQYLHDQQVYYHVSSANDIWRNR
jgi:hypothetical protein